MVRPYALPTSLAVVSASLEAKEATKPRRQRMYQSVSPNRASPAMAAPERPEPHTLGGPRRPPRASAMPSACFCASLSFVTAEPTTK